MFAPNLKLSPRARKFMLRHPGLFEPLAMERVWNVTSTAILIDIPVDDRAIDYMGSRLLPYLAARFREIAWSQRAREDGMNAEHRAGGGDPTRCFVEMAEKIEAYVAEKGIEVPLMFEPKVVPGASDVETEWARAVLDVMRGHSMLMAAAELIDRPAWQHGLILQGVEKLRAAMDASFDAAAILYQLDEMVDYGPADMFRVLIRHGAGLPDPQGLTPEQTLACSSTRRTLADAWIMPRLPVDAATALALATAETRDAMGSVSMSFNGWLDEDHRRFEKPEGFPVRIPLRPAVEADLIDLGLAERVRGKLRLTKLGAVAAQLKAAPEAGED